MRAKPRVQKVFRIPETINKKLENIAKEMNLSQNAVVELALELFEKPERPFEKKIIKKG